MFVTVQSSNFMRLNIKKIDNSVYFFHKNYHKRNNMRKKVFNNWFNEEVNVTDDLVRITGNYIVAILNNNLFYMH